MSRQCHRRPLSRAKFCPSWGCRPSVLVNGRVHTPCALIYPFPKKASSSQRDEGGYPKGEVGFWQVMAAARNWSKINSPKAGSYFKPLWSSRSQYCLFLPMATGRGGPGVTRVLPMANARGWVKLLLGFLPGYFVMGRKRIKNRRCFQHLCPEKEFFLTGNSSFCHSHIS